jgi:hypothetical protein
MLNVVAYAMRIMRAHHNTMGTALPEFDAVLIEVTPL